MRIGIDYTAAVRQGGGIGRYTRNLVRALAEQEDENEYVLWLAGGRAGLDSSAWPARFRFRAVPISDRWVNILWQRMRLPLPIEALVGPLDLFHSPDFVLPPTRRSTRTVLTVHDLSFLRVPDCYIPRFREYLASAVRRAASNADLILADSESTSCDLQQLMGVAGERIRVVYPGVEPHFRPVRETAELMRVRKKYRLRERFILGLGTLQPRKNFTGLIEAFSYLTNMSVDLVIVGEEGWLHEPIFEAIRQRALNDRVHILGFVDDQDLPVVYSLASAFAFPSWYEGFGLPVLEAMACGTPVVAANNSSLPEVAGDAAVLVDAASPEQLAEGLRGVLTDTDHRDRLVSGGYRQAQQFTWARAARHVRACYLK